jgi:predicted DNA-binding transcriptional regulator AlpA
MSSIVEARGRETLTMPEGCHMLGISLKHGYDLAAEGNFPCRTIRLGRTVRIVRRSFEALLAGSDQENADCTTEQRRERVPA